MTDLPQPPNASPSDDRRWGDSDVPWRDRPWPRPFDDCGDLTFGDVDVPFDQLGHPAADQTTRS